MTQFKTGEGAIKKVKKDILLHLVENNRFPFLQFFSVAVFWGCFTALVFNVTVSLSVLICLELRLRVEFLEKFIFLVEFISMSIIL